MRNEKRDQKISKLLLEVYIVLKNAESWLSTQEIADAINSKGLSINTVTVNRHTRYLLNRQACDELVLHPVHLFKLSDNAKETEVCKNLEDTLMRLSKKTH